MPDTSRANGTHCQESCAKTPQGLRAMDAAIAREPKRVLTRLAIFTNIPRTEVKAIPLEREDEKSLYAGVCSRFRERRRDQVRRFRLWWRSLWITQARFIWISSGKYPNIGWT